MSKEIKRGHDFAEASLSRFIKYMPRSKDITLIILKGHLLIEQEMNEILDANLTESKALFDARMTFSNRLAVVKSIYGSSSNGFPYDRITKLNSLRNQPVHNLEPKYLEKKVVDFVKDVEDSESELIFSKMKLEVRLKRSLAFLCGEICGFREGAKRVNKRLTKPKKETPCY